MSPDGQRRLRLRFTKAGKIRFTSHRDVARIWERALRRSRLPLAYSQGFVPHPLVSFGLALPDGLRVAAASTSTCASKRLDLGRFLFLSCPAALSALLPEGMEVQAAALIGEAEGSLQQEVASCDWELEVLGVRDEELQERVEKCSPLRCSRSAGSGRVVRSTTTSDRPSEHSPSTSTNGRLRAELATHPRGVRPSDLVAALGTDAVPGRACRTHQWIERDGARFEPLPVSGLGTDGDATQHARRAFPHVRDGNQPHPGGSRPGAAGGSSSSAPDAPRATPRPKPKIGDTRPAPVVAAPPPPKDDVAAHRRPPHPSCRSGGPRRPHRGSQWPRGAACPT